MKKTSHQSVKTFYAPRKRTKRPKAEAKKINVTDKQTDKSEIGLLV